MNPQLARLLCSLVLVQALVLVAQSAPSKPQKDLIDPDATRTLLELVVARGFNLLSYPVVTSDGYILTLHRVVPLGAFNGSEYSKNRKPIIVQHGLYSSSADFMTNSPFVLPQNSSNQCGDNFVFCLVLTGRYDVWLPNSRGNDYSAANQPVASLLLPYWQFSWDQMATKDCPAVIEFVQQATGHQKVGWVGHSQGTVMMFALLSLQPEYADVIEPFVAWAPPIFIGQMTSAARPLLAGLGDTFRLTGGKFILSSELYGFLQQVGCTIVEAPCAALYNALYGASDSLNLTRLDVYYHFNPSGTSNWAVSHFSQMINTDNFYRFNYGSFSANLAVYGLPGTVPLVNLYNIRSSMNIALVYGITDGFVPVSGVLRLKQMLKTAGVNVIDYEVPKNPFNHMDFLWAQNAGGLVYDKTIEILDQFS